MLLTLINCYFQSTPCILQSTPWGTCNPHFPNPCSKSIPIHPSCVSLPTNRGKADGCIAPRGSGPKQESASPCLVIAHTINKTQASLSISARRLLWCPNVCPTVLQLPKKQHRAEGICVQAIYLLALNRVSAAFFLPCEPTKTRRPGRLGRCRGD